jgi:hypothetical protein
MVAPQGLFYYWYTLLCFGLRSTATMSLYTLPALQRHGRGGDNGNQRDYASAKLSSKATKNVHKLQLLLVKKGTKVGKSHTKMIHLPEPLYFIAKQ